MVSIDWYSFFLFTSSISMSQLKSSVKPAALNACMTGSVYFSCSFSLSGEWIGDNISGGFRVGSRRWKKEVILGSWWGFDGVFFFRLNVFIALWISCSFWTSIELLVLALRGGLHLVARCLSGLVGVESRPNWATNNEVGTGIGVSILIIV